MVNIFGLAIGMSACFFIFQYVHFESGYDRFNKNADRIFRVGITYSGNLDDITATNNPAVAPTMKSDLAGVEDFARVAPSSLFSNGSMVSYKDEKGNTKIFNEEKIFMADPSFLSIFSFPFIAGNPSTALNQHNTMVISETMSEKYFGKKDVVGRILELNTGEKFEPFIVSAVTKRSPQNSSIKIDMLLPMKFAQTIWNDDQWVNFGLNTFFVLKPGSGIQAVETKFATIFNNEAASQLKEMADRYGFKDKVKFNLQPLLQMHLSKDFPSSNGLTDASNPMYSYILTGIALFILLIACINFINLTVAYSLKRSKEIGIRKVVGGQRKQLIAQF